MEDNQEPQAQQQNQVPVMDIQPARPVQIERPVPTPPPAGAPVPEQPANPPAVPAPANETTEMTQGASETVPVLAAVATGHKSHRTPILAVVLAIIIAGAFAAVAVLVYLSNPGAQQSPNSNTVQEDQATEADVTATDKAIDDSLSSTDDATDYNNAGVSDATLGL